MYLSKGNTLFKRSRVIFLNNVFFLSAIFMVVEKGGAVLLSLGEPFTSSFKSDKFVLNN